MFSSPPDQSEKEEDQVLTPGGFRPKHLVHEVKPGEAVRQEADGTYSIVPAETIPETDTHD